MAAVLGIFDGVHDAGAALVVDGTLVAACNEERFTRRKGQGGRPDASIRACLALGGVDPSDVDQVAWAGFVNPNPVLRMWRQRQKRFRLDEGAFPGLSGSLSDRWLALLQFQSPFPRMSGRSLGIRAAAPILRRALARQLEPLHISAPATLVDHHRCHAGAAWLSSGFERTLVLISDGLGDGLCTSVYLASEGRLQRLHAQPFPHSYGILYATICSFYGFRPFRHEGKLVGLAARGDADAVDVAFPFSGPPTDRRFTWRLRGSLNSELRRLKHHRREDVCAWLQRGVERDLCNLAAHWMRQTGATRLALAGGVMANVRLNQHLAALPEVHELFVFPHMGDGGLGAGAALLTAGAEPQRLDHAYLGPAPDETRMQRAIERLGHPFSRPANLEEQVADIVAGGGFVARVTGRLEFGPRALGHRTIFAPAHPDSINDTLNGKLSRSEFMPFAPAVMADRTEGWLHIDDTVRHACRFMTVAVDATEQAHRRCPAAVHVDGTARPQLVHEDTSPSMARVLRAYEAKTGIPLLINTSFNRHEEPIVHTAEDAVRAYADAGLDALALGPFLVRRPTAADSATG